MTITLTRVGPGRLTHMPLDALEKTRHTGGCWELHPEPEPSSQTPPRKGSQLTSIAVMQPGFALTAFLLCNAPSGRDSFMPETSGEPKTEAALTNNSARELSGGITRTELQVDTATSPRYGRSGNGSLTTMARWPVAAGKLLVAGWGGQPHGLFYCLMDLTRGGVYDAGIQVKGNHHG